MNLELLRKLVKLANNNSNENEANAAARKVCEMLEEDGAIFHSVFEGRSLFYKPSRAQADYIEKLRKQNAERKKNG